MKMTEEKQTEEEQHIDLRKIRETFAKDRFATENGAIVEEVREHYARCSIELTERHYNAAGGVMGVCTSCWQTLHLRLQRIGTAWEWCP